MFGKRIHNLCDVGFIPVLSKPTECPDALWPDVRLCLVNKCLAELTKDLKERSFNGCWLPDPYGTVRVSGRCTLCTNMFLLHILHRRVLRKEAPPFLFFVSEHWCVLFAAAAVACSEQQVLLLAQCLIIVLCQVHFCRSPGFRR